MNKLERLHIWAVQNWAHCRALTDKMNLGSSYLTSHGRAHRIHFAYLPILDKYMTFKIGQLFATSNYYLICILKCRLKFECHRG